MRALQKAILELALLTLVAAAGVLVGHLAPSPPPPTPPADLHAAR